MEKENIIYQSEKDYGEIAEEVYISYPNNKGFEIQNLSIQNQLPKVKKLIRK
jgi:hypothetical protein|nr:MAG TPA: hypothetical protein [Caudoviricetes sp.]